MPWPVRTLAVTAGLGLLVMIAARRLAGRGDPPRVTFEPPSPPRAMAIHYTGDAGPSASDRSMARRWCDSGLRVVLVNSLRYFLRRTPPARQARDLARLIAEHGGGRLPVLLSGFSFGADAVPFAYLASNARVRRRIGLVALISPTRRISFHSTPRSILGLLDGRRDVAGAIARLPADIAFCVIGAADGDNPCGDDPRVAHLPRVVVPGGHHLDAAPADMADAILHAFDARAAALSAATPAPRRRSAG